MADDLVITDNVIVVNFQQDSSAYEGLTRLKELNSQGQLELRAAAVVARGEDGKVAVKDEIGDNDFTGTATGGVVGLLIGIIGGPLGVLIGGATGLLVGSLFDIEDADETESVLSQISKAVRVGHTALLAQVGEQSREVVDSAMTQLGGSVFRRPTLDVEAEIAEADEAQRVAKKEARKRLHEQHHAEHQEKVHEKVDALKAKLHHSQPVGSTGS